MFSFLSDSRHLSGYGGPCSHTLGRGNVMPTSVSLNFICLNRTSFLKSSFGILNYIVQGGERKGKCSRVTSRDREASVEETLPPSQMGRPSQPQPWPELGHDLSSDSSDDERNLVSFTAIMNAVEDAATEFEGDRRCLNRWPGPLFSEDSSDMEYSSATELSNASSSPQFEEDCECTGGSRVYTQEVIVFTKNADEFEEVNILDWDVN